MKYQTFIIASMAAILASGCNERKTAADEAATESKDLCDSEMAGADDNDASARLEWTRAEARNISEQALLDAYRREAKAKADAAEARSELERR